MNDVRSTGMPRSSVFARIERQLTAPDGPFALDHIDVGGTRLRTWRHQADSLRQLFDRSPAADDDVYIVLDDERWTYGEHRGAVAQLAGQLGNTWGIRPGDRVAIAMRNLPEWSIAFWAATLTGAVAVPLNAWWTSEELDYALRDSGASLVVCDDERLERILSTDLDIACLVCRRAEDAPPGRHTRRWEDFVDRSGQSAPLADVALAPDDPATLLYTSGTTGHPKGVLGTHRNICGTVVSVDYVAAWSAAVAESARAQPSGPVAPPTLLLAVPLFHATGLHGVLVGTMARGGRIVMMRRWDPAAAFDLIDREHVTAFTAVPAMVRQLSDQAAERGRSVGTLASVTSGGAATPSDLVHRVNDRSPGTSMRTGYGLTESSTLVAIIGGSDYLAHPDSVGVPIPICDVRIVDESGDDVAVGAVGEILLRGTNIVPGYWNLHDVNQTVFRDGWFRTGDLGRFDDEGYLYVVDRVKDIIIRGGENISASEVESVLYRLDDIADAAVVAVPHDVLGEEVGAVIQRRPGSRVSAEDVRAHAREHLAAYKVPAHVVFVDEPLPRSPQGKVRKPLIRAMFDSVGPAVSGESTS